MKPRFEGRIARAKALERTHPGAAGLLEFYGRLCELQGRIFDRFQSSGETDMGALTPCFPDLLDLSRRQRLDPVLEYAHRALSTAEAREALLRRRWENPALNGDPPQATFLAKALLQPYAEYLASRGDPGLTPLVQPHCPFCGNRPVLAALRGEGDGGKRWLVCCLCSTEWEYRRVICPSCDNEDNDQLPVYSTGDSSYVRVEACDACHSYLKAVDLTKNGLAIPVVDDIATLPIDLWAAQNGYSRIEPNIIGV